MVYSIGYRRPSWVSGESLNEKATSIDESTTSETSSLSKGIPEALSFDRIISGGTCPPCTTRDFMNYLKYISYDAENLQFFLWYKDYCKRFENLPASEKALAPEWSTSQSEMEAAKQAARRSKLTPAIAGILKGTDFAEVKTQTVEMDGRDPSDDTSRAASPTSPVFPISDYGSSIGEQRPTSSQSGFHRKADEALNEAGMKWKPFTAQPFREEMTRIITIYIANNGSRQLNLSDRERTAILHALQNTTHPSALIPAVTSVEYSLRQQAHPNFIRWTICNGNRPRVLFARGLGVSLISLGIIAEILITLSRAGRAWRVLPIVLLLLGISTLVAAWKGMCVVLHGLHHRHLRPWELFAEPEDAARMSEEKSNSSSDNLVDTGTHNSYEDEPWVAKYEKRNIIRKICDREVWVQEPALRQIQDTIFLQSLLIAFVVSCIIVGIFCAVPHGNFY